MAGTSIFQWWMWTPPSLWSTNPVQWRPTWHPGRVGKITLTFWTQDLELTFFSLDANALRQVWDASRKSWERFTVFDFRPCRPALVVLTAAGVSTEPYRGRINVNERSITISAVTGVDEGSYTVRDNKGVIKQKVCLNVIGEDSWWRLNIYLYLCMTCFSVFIQDVVVALVLCSLACSNGFLKTEILMVG